MTSREFPMSVIASVCQNRLLCPFSEYREFLDFATGAKVPLWDVERARRATAKRLEGLFGELSKMPRLPEKTDSGNAGKHVRECIKATGADTLVITSGLVRYTERSLAKALK